MGLVDVARRLVYGYLRLVGLSLLIGYSLLQRAWLSVRPALTPVVNIYETIDQDKASVNVVVQQFVRLLLLAGVVYMRLVQSVWETVSSPFRTQLRAAEEFLEGLRAEYQEVTQPKES